MSRQGRPQKIGINAALVSMSRSYRSAGISHYLLSLLQALRESASEDDVAAYLGPVREIFNSHAISFHASRGAPAGSHPLLKTIAKKAIFGDDV